MLLGTLDISLLGNMVAGKGNVRGGEGLSSEQVEEQIELTEILSAALSFN